jgi:hypothetical protein
LPRALTALRWPASRRPFRSGFRAEFYAGLGGNRTRVRIQKTRKHAPAQAAGSVPNDCGPLPPGNGPQRSGGAARLRLSGGAVRERLDRLLTASSVLMTERHRPSGTVERRRRAHHGHRGIADAEPARDDTRALRARSHDGHGPVGWGEQPVVFSARDRVQPARLAGLALLALRALLTLRAALTRARARRRDRLQPGAVGRLVRVGSCTSAFCTSSSWISGSSISGSCTSGSWISSSSAPSRSSAPGLACGTDDALAVRARGAGASRAAGQPARALRSGGAERAGRTWLHRPVELGLHARRASATRGCSPCRRSPSWSGSPGRGPTS